MPADVATPMLIRSDRVVLYLAGGLAVCAGLAHFGGWNAVLTFAVAAGAVAVLAALVGRSVEQLGDRFGAGATGVLQSALGNLPELFICIFSLRAGLVDVVRAALVGSILANLVLVLGLAFIAGAKAGLLLTIALTLGLLGVDHADRMADMDDHIVALRDIVDERQADRLLDPTK